MKRYLLLCIFLLVGCSGPPVPMTSAYIVQSFKDAGLTITNIEKTTQLPDGTTEGTRFEIPSVGNGTVEVFSSASDASKEKGYMSGTGAWAFQKGVVVVILSVSVDEATARQYEKVLEDLKF